MNNLDAYPHYMLKENLQFTMSAGDPLPEGDYVVMEYYLPNEEKQGRLVALELLEVCWDEKTSRLTEYSLAILKYILDKPVSADNPQPYPVSEKPELMNDVLAFFSEFLSSHPDYTQTLSQRYEIQRTKEAKLVETQPLSSEPQSPILRSQQTGRNDPCPCGSTKKFKKCCMGK